MLSTKPYIILIAFLRNSKFLKESSVQVGHDNVCNNFLLSVKTKHKYFLPFLTLELVKSFILINL